MAKAYRAWLVTSNNPQRYYGWAKGLPDEPNAEECRKALEESVAEYVRGANGRERDPAKNGVVAVFERGESGTLHAHHLVMASSPIKFDALQRKFSHSEIEPVRGTADEAVDYLWKRGAHEDKADTQLCEPVVFGSLIADNKGASEDRPVFTEIDELLEQGLSPREIYRLGAKYSFYRASIETAYNARMAAKIPQVRDVACYYHVGASGSGKSHTLFELQRRFGTDGVFMVNGLYKNIWDTYDFEPCVMLDDFRGTAMPLHALLGIMDCYYTLARCRYADKPLAFTELHITSVVPPERLYEFGGDEQFEQLRRRIRKVVYHWVEVDADGKPVYLGFEQSSGEYEGYDVLKRKAFDGRRSDMADEK